MINGSRYPVYPIILQALFSIIILKIVFGVIFYERIFYSYSYIVVYNLV